METLDITSEAGRQVWACRTHAFAAELFAGYPRSPGMSQKWSEIAEFWSDVAAKKERAIASYQKIASQMAELQAHIEMERLQS